MNLAKDGPTRTAWEKFERSERLKTTIIDGAVRQYLALEEFNAAWAQRRLMLAAPDARFVKASAERDNATTALREAVKAYLEFARGES